ncbi:NUDIX hydrolase [Bartonella australis AUST/NH1]|uniref:NUDIX hydrolase n=1 Tax=Bartonella australis (strain Aust/NH1) TaxID=1094489 RepID=M1NYL3_BARAA|nr:NUDIX hydrolase [Bartonella australis]AGF74532.1 NUDIX hydrolase [Bartonella australis AUST/NH1]
MIKKITGSDIAHGKYILVDNTHFLQVGALIYRVKNGILEFLLITSRGSGRWVIPKGWPISRQSFSQTVLQEAFEEAGIRGIVDTFPIGTYEYEKLDLRKKNSKFCVYVFSVLYLHQEKEWPEQNQRTYEWVTALEAAGRISEPKLKKILLQYKP